MPRTTTLSNKLLKDLDIPAFSEYWLHNYELNSLTSFHNDFNFFALSSSKEDAVFCQPRYTRGHHDDGTGIAWRKDLDKWISKVSIPNTHRPTRIKLHNSDKPPLILAAYLPARSGCTDDFKETLDVLDGFINTHRYENDIIILGDFNADPDPPGGPKATTPFNEQGRILKMALSLCPSTPQHITPFPCLRKQGSQLVLNN